MPKELDYFCATRCREAGVSLAGSAGYKPYQLLMELAEPWESAPTASPAFPDALNLLFKHAARQGRPFNFNAVAPDDEYSRRGWRWVSLLALPPSGAVRYERLSYQVPEEQLEALITHLLNKEAPAALESHDPFANYRGAVGDEWRDILVCGHASRDRCCGKWGQELYHYLRQQPYLAHHKVRVWRSSHIGGHRFAPTLFEVPAMRWWGQLTATDADAILKRQGSSSVVARCYRGFAGLREPAEQLLEQAAFEKEGWAMLDAEELSVVSQSLGEGSTRASIAYRLKDSGDLRQLGAEVSRGEGVEAYGSCGEAEPKVQRSYHMQLLKTQP